MIRTENGYYDYSANKYYFYVRDHLGNNRVVTDQTATAVQSTQYYPFGMAFATSTGQNGQRFKYNDKELDLMHGLNMYDYSARHIDMGNPRFTTQDPLAEKYYSISPYAYCANNPVNNVDLRGDSITTVINTTVNNPDGTTSIQSYRYYYGQDANGNYGFIDSSGNLYSGNDQFVNNLTTALGNLRSGGNNGNALVSNLISSTNNVQVVMGRNTADINGSFIRWNPSSTTGGINTAGNENRPAYIGLGHEMAHIQDTWNGTIDNSAWVTVGGQTIPNSEKYATHVENQLRAENGIPLRTHYGIDASTGVRVGLGSTEIVRSGVSVFYTNASNHRTTIVNGMPVTIITNIPFRY